MKQRVMVSMSASDENVDALLFVLIVMVLELYSNDISVFFKQLKPNMDKASDFLKQHGVYKGVSTFFTQFLQTKEISHEDAVDLGTYLNSREVKAKFQRDTTISHDQLTLLKAAITALIKDSDSAWLKLQKHVSILNDPEINLLISDDMNAPVDVSPKQIARQLKILVRELTGNTNSYFLTLQQNIELGKKYPAEIQEYRRYVSMVNKLVKVEVLKFVRRQRSPLVRADVVKAHLDGMGIPNNIVTGLTGAQMDEQGNVYTAEGRKLIPTPTGLVKMNPAYDPNNENTYVARPADGGRPEYRTETYTRANKQKRLGIVQEFLASEHEHRGKWLSDLSKKGSVDQILGALTEIMYYTAARIGDPGNMTAGETTYGLSTLTVNHIKVLPTKILLDYAGKKGTNQYAEYRINSPESKKVAEIVKGLIQGKRPTDYVFTYGRRRIARNEVSMYIKQVTGMSGMTNHYFRRLTGTRMALTLLKKAPFSKDKHPSQTEVERWFKAEMTKVGEVLHHRTGQKVTSSTAIKSYIDTNVMADFFTNLGLRVPKAVLEAEKK